MFQVQTATVVGNTLIKDDRQRINPKKKQPSSSFSKKQAEGHKQDIQGKITKTRKTTEIKNHEREHRSKAWYRSDE